MSWAALGDVACRVLAQGRIVRRWREGSGPDRQDVVLVEGPWGRRVVAAAGECWAAYEVGPGDLDVVERLAATDNLFNLGACLRLVEPTCTS